MLRLTSTRRTSKATTQALQALRATVTTGPGSVDSTKDVEPAGQRRGRGRGLTPREVRKLQYFKERQRRDQLAHQEAALEEEAGVQTAEGGPAAPGRLRYPVCVTDVGQCIREDIWAFFAPLVALAKSGNIRAKCVEHEPIDWWVNFDTEEVRERALSFNKAYLGSRQVKLRPGTVQEMLRATATPLAKGSRSRFVLMTNVQLEATLEDITNFLDGFELLNHSVTTFHGQDDLHIRADGSTAKWRRKRAIVRLTNRGEAYRLLRSRNHDFLLNLPVNMSVIP